MSTRKWSTFTLTSKVAIYKHILRMLVDNGCTYIDQNLLSCIVRLLCRIARQSWNEDLEFSNLPGYCSEFLAQKLSVACVGLHIIRALIDDMGPSSEHQLIQHQRNSTKFKNFAVPVLFYNTSSCLKRFVLSDSSSDEKMQIVLLVVEIFSKTLEFCEDSDENRIFLPMPNSFHWEVLKFPATVEQLYDIYILYQTNTRITTNVLRILGLVISITPNFFHSDGIRNEIIGRVIKIAQDLLVNKVGLDNEDNVHEYIRLLSNITATQCSFEVLVMYNISVLIEGAFGMTKTLLLTNTNQNLLSNMLLFWESLCGFAENSEELSLCIFEITKLYIQYLIQHKDLVDEESILNFVSPIASLNRVKFSELTLWIIEIFERLSDTAVQSNCESLTAVISILCSFIAHDKNQYIALLSNKTLKNDQKITNPEFLSSTIEILYHIIVLFRHVVESENKNVKLLKSCLTFVRWFIKVFFCSTCPEVFMILAKKMGFDTENQILIVILSEVFKILQQNNEKVYQCCMELFSEIISSTMILKRNDNFDHDFYCGIVRFEAKNIIEILENYSTESFYFMNNKIANKNRRFFVKSILKLYFLMNKKISLDFDQMLQPVNKSIEEAKMTRNELVVHSLCLDLTGAAESISNSDQYCLFFAWLCQKSLTLKEIFETPQTSENLIRIFKFLQELTFNRSERLSYIENKAICSVVFKFCERILNAYYSNLVPKENYEDPYKEFYKPLCKAIHIISNTLTGGYSNIGLLISDPSVIFTLKLIVRAIVIIPSEDITQYIEKFKIIFQFLNCMSENSQMLREIIFRLEKAEIEKLSGFLIEGCQSYNQYVCQLSFTVIKKIVFNLIFKTSAESKEFIAKNSKCLIEIMKVLLMILFGGEAQNISLFSYPLLGIINLFKDEFQAMLPSLYYIQGIERFEL